MLNNEYLDERLFMEMESNLNDPLASEEDAFYFESDHLALKGNKDYCDVLKTIVILSAQQKKAIEDFNKVVEIRKKALEDPIYTLEQIQNGKDLEEDLKIVYSDAVDKKSEEDGINIGQNSGSNKAWTPEEQKRLEELLVIFPPEPVEMRRFHKIARALGNRTVQQVCSRVQKYFLKLYKAGLPIPGRIPKSSEKYKKSMMHKHQRHNHYLWKPTTFFPELYVPVTMNDLENTPGPSLNSPAPTSALPTSLNYLIPTETHSSNSRSTTNESEQQLNLLKKVKMEKLNELTGNDNLFQHFGYRCDYCDVEPITGSRWHCITCADSVDFCTDCVVSQMYSQTPHPIHHSLKIFCNDVDEPKSPGSDLDSNVRG
ncbi:hypothetical protein NQ315_009309 [Exocentrus adspersus]|uniref:ZZ-type domain-containing protein n=1 Tax=Exocentrus adspersus TaxID=1586481 RepID=A0AAV8WH92_9CUCU|nr:hypothetical protein NQ315_009309 [Exocentrus adspersus]